MIRNYAMIMPICSIILLFSANISADDATSYSAPATTPMTLCSDMIVNSNPRLTPTPTPNPLADVDSSTCTSGLNGGGGAWAGVPPFGVGIGGGFTPNCKGSSATQPYLAGIKEAWAGDFWVGGGMGMTVTCCPNPVTTMSFTSGYKSGSPGFDTWQPGPDCK